MSAAAAAYRLIRSPKLAIVVLLALALMASVGTIPVADPVAPPRTVDRWSSLARIAGLRGTFSSPLFLSLVALSLANVAACTWHRLSPRVRRGGVDWRVGTDVAIHGSVVLLVAGGALKVLFGFVGTQNIHVGAVSPTVYDWKRGRDVSLGFDIGIDDFQLRHYPLRAMVGVRSAATGAKIALLEVVEGSETASPSGEVRLSLAGYDDITGMLRLKVSGGGELTLDTASKNATARVGEFDLVLVAYRADVKSAEAVVSLREPGAGLAGRRLGTNDRIGYRGTSLFLTAWGFDPEGRRFCGIQVVRDPGAPVFWLGCIVLGLAIPLHLLVKGRRPAPAPQIRA